MRILVALAPLLVACADRPLQPPGTNVTLSCTRPASFAATSTVKAGARVALGDFNADGLPDVYNVHDSVWVNDGTGAFTQAWGPALDAIVDPPSYDTLSVGDLDGDRVPDVLLASWTSGFDVALGTKTPALKPSVNVATGTAELAGRAVDLDGDGRAEIVLVDAEGQLVIGHWKHGAFHAQQSTKLATILPPAYMDFADFDNDGKLDIAVGDYTGKLLVARADGTVLWSAPDSPYNSVSGLSAADVNGDGNVDLTYTGRAYHSDGDNFFIRLGDGQGNFGEPSEHLTKQGLSIPSYAMTDLDHDGIEDALVVMNTGSGVTVSFLRGKGDGSFRTPTKLTYVNAYGQVLVADLDGDGCSDLLVADDQLNVTTYLRD